MEKAIIGKKIGMTQIFDEAGRVVPVTVIEAGPCTVVQKKTAEKDGYEAIQLGYETVPERKLTKPEVGHQKKAGLTEFKKVLKEFALEDCSKYEVGDELKADVFAAGDRVDVTGISKGHGFQGVVKRAAAVGHALDGGAVALNPRRRPCPPSSGFPGRRHHPRPHLQGPRRRRSDGQRAGHRPEPGRGPG